MLQRLWSGAGLLLDWMLPAVCAGCERPLPPGRRSARPMAGSDAAGRRYGDDAAAPVAGNDAHEPAAGGVAPVFETELRGWCAGCVAALPGVDARRCAVCGERLPGGPSGDDGREPPQTVAPCARCQACPPAFDRTIVLADYAPPLDHLVQAIKFGGESALAAPLGRMMARTAARAFASRLHTRPDTIVPIPLAPARLASRGFNQALLLARPVAHALGLRAAPVHLRRVRQGAPASSLDAAQRRGALEQAFVARGLAPGAVVLVVDDVMTTGATLQAAAAALKAAGAAVVVNCVALRTPLP